jgi:hypothetical protein
MLKSLKDIAANRMPSVSESAEKDRERSGRQAVQQHTANQRAAFVAAGKCHSTERRSGKQECAQHCPRRDASHADRASSSH